MLIGGSLAIDCRSQFLTTWASPQGCLSLLIIGLPPEQVMRERGREEENKADSTIFFF